MNTKLDFLLRSLLAAGALSLGGCHLFVTGPRRSRSHHSEPVHYQEAPRHQERHVVVVTPAPEPEHVHYCDDHCDHMWNGASFVIVVGHRHGHNCGHELSGRRWVRARVVIDDHDHDDGHGGGRRNGNGHGNGRR